MIAIKLIHRLMSSYLSLLLSLESKINSPFIHSFVSFVHSFKIITHSVNDYYLCGIEARISSFPSMVCLNGELCVAIVCRIGSEADMTVLLVGSQWHCWLAMTFPLISMSKVLVISSTQLLITQFCAEPLITCIVVFAILSWIFISLLLPNTLTSRSEPNALAF